MKKAIRDHLRDFLAIIGLLIVALGIAVYVLSQQNFRFPLVEEQPKRIEMQLDNAQAVQPGQGQTVRVAGVEIGRIGKVRVKQGRAVVELEIEKKFKNVVREDATALLRPKTALKDMLVEIDPGRGRVLPDGGTIELANTDPDINPDEIYEALDSDARAYLKLLVVGAGKGLHRRGNDLKETLERLGPLHKDLARVSVATARRRVALKTLVHNYSELIGELGRQPGDLRRLVLASNDVFEATASQRQNISTAVRRLPGTLRQTESTLRKVQGFSPILRTTLSALRRPIRELAPTNAAVRPFLRETTPIIKNEIRPFTRAAQPWTEDLRVGAANTARAAPDLTRAGGELNRFFNMGAYNPKGAEPLTGNDTVDRARQEGLLYWLAWTANNGVSLFSTADAQGPWRRLTLCNLPLSFVQSLINQLIAQILAEAPSTTPAQINALLTPVLQSGIGVCQF